MQENRARKVVHGQRRKSHQQMQSEVQFSVQELDTGNAAQGAAQIAEETTKAFSTCTKVLTGVLILVVVSGGIFAGVYFGAFASEAATTKPSATTLGPGETTTPSSDTTTVNPGMSDQEWSRARGECGTSRRKPVLDRIVGGEEAVRHSWPWQVGLLKYRRYSAYTASVKAFCGGTLVGPQYVITATHCFLNTDKTSTTTEVDNFRVLVGAHDKGKETSGAKMLEIESIIHHPKNNLATFVKNREIPIYDITILVLKTIVDPSVVSPMTAFACLPKPNIRPRIGRKCWATGWGKTHGTGYDKQLKQVPQPITSQQKCKEKYGENGIKSQYHICAGPYRGNEGTCQGDSGGPLVCQDEDSKWVLQGDTSFGPKPCGVSPSVWVQISHQMEWICCILKDYGPCEGIQCKTS